jgi:alkanesulfonate monooxygenase
MSLRFHWFLPTNGDGRDIVGGGHGVATGAAGAIRPPSIAYLGQIARSAEQLGFEGALTPTGAWCEDSWLTCAMLTEVTERLKFLVAFRPGQISPTLAAQMASTFQRQSRSRWRHPAPAEAPRAISPFAPTGTVEPAAAS